MVPSGSEGSAARACREFHERHKGARFTARREAIARFAADFYERRLLVPPTADQREAFDRLANPNTLALEMAHDGQLPHLGIVRLVLKTHDIALIDGHAATLYLVGNHYTPAMRPDNVRFGMPLNGMSPDTVKHPPKLRIGKANARVPFRWLPPPKREDLDRLRDQVAEFVANNIANEKKLGTQIRPGAEDAIRARLDDLFGVFKSAAEVASLGDWLIRVQHDLFHRMLAEDADHILFLPMADLVDLFREELEVVARADPAVSRIKAAVSAEQQGRGEDLYQSRAEASSFWLHCPACRRRQRTAWSPDAAIDFVCEACGHRADLAGAEVWRWLMPDIVAYEEGLFHLDIDGWVVGSHAAYHPVIERVAANVFHEDVPPRFFLTSVPTFRGAGDPLEGYPKTRLTRAWLEMKPEAIARALRAPWDENPRLVSDQLEER